MFLPTEGLYSEVVRNPEFSFDNLRREEQIVLLDHRLYHSTQLTHPLIQNSEHLQRVDDISKALWEASTRI